MAGGVAAESDRSADGAGGATVKGGQSGWPGAWEGSGASGERNRGQMGRKRRVHPTGSDRCVA